MQARAPLMIEHRLIERMISLIEETLAEAEKTNRMDPDFIDTVVDFIRTYADRTHHGKEEDILFRDLKERSMSDGDRQMMEILISEHKYGRKTVKALDEANKRYQNGDDAALKDISNNLSRLVLFYPKHIEKEDKTFFPAARRYFTEEEDHTMLAEFYKFDQKMIHEKYTSVVDNLEASE